MFQNLSEKMTAAMIENGSIQPEEAEFYRYGIGQSIFLILNLAVFLLIGCLGGMLRQTILFYMFYAVLRKFTGGIHAKTPVACGLFSDFLLLGAMGGRFDHALGNISILLYLFEHGAGAVLADDYSFMKVCGRFIPVFSSVFFLLQFIRPKFIPF